VQVLTNPQSLLAIRYRLQPAFSPIEPMTSVRDKNKPS
jgi:hypothetical protein